MPVSFVIDSKTSIVHATATGIISYADVLTYIAGKLRAGVITKDELIDLRDVTLDLSAADLPAIAGEVSNALAGQPPGRIAVLTNSAIIYGLARGYAELTKGHGTRLEVFHDLATAREWLANQRLASEKK